MPHFFDMMGFMDITLDSVEGNKLHDLLIERARKSGWTLGTGIFASLKSEEEPVELGISRQYFKIFGFLYSASMDNWIIEDELVQNLKDHFSDWLRNERTEENAEAYDEVTAGYTRVLTFFENPLFVAVNS